MYKLPSICSNCNIELSKIDHKALEIVSLGKLYCQDCLLEQCRHLFLDDKGHLNDKWDQFERLVIGELQESYNDDDKFFTETYEETMRRYEK